MKVNSFLHLSLDGYYADASSDMSCFKCDDPEINQFASESASGEGGLILGRITYELMVAFWPTERAKQMLPEVAAGMNSRQKIVFSRTLESVSWDNARLVHDDPVAEIKKLKETGGPDMTILGSGSIVRQLAEAGLVDELQFIYNPIALGGGKAIFAGIRDTLRFELAHTKSFRSGSVLLTYRKV